MHFTTYPPIHNLCISLYRGKASNGENYRRSGCSERKCVDANQKFVDDNGGLEGVERMFSDYLQSKIDTAVSAAVSTAVAEERDKSDRQTLDIILGYARQLKQSFDDALASANLADSVKERVRNLYLSQAQ